MFKSQFEITNPKLKAFVYNEKVYKTVLGIMFVFSSISVSSILAEMNHDINTSADKILFANIIWIFLYTALAVLYTIQIDFAPLTFAVSTYFVFDYTIGSFLAAVYNVHSLPITNIIKIGSVIIILVLYIWLKWLKSKAVIPDKPKEYIKMKWSVLDSLSMIFFMAGGMVLGEITVIAGFCDNLKTSITVFIIILMVTVIFLIILFPIYSEHFKMGKNLYFTLVNFAGIVVACLLGLNLYFDGNLREITVSFWYSLFDALNLIG